MADPINTLSLFSSAREPTMKQNRLVPWFGCDLAVAERIAKKLSGRAHVAIPFAGSAAIVPFLKVRSGVLNDLHRHVVNLFRCIARDDARSELLTILDATLFHPDELSRAQRRCIEHEANFDESLFGPRKPAGSDEPDPRWAADYFAACWMGRGGHAGTAGEFTQNLAVRYTAGGGDSARRFRSAIESLDAWSAALKSWQCTCLDAVELLYSIPDGKDNAIYCDPPWPEVGDKYNHRFSENQHRRLAARLGVYTATRVVLRYSDHPLARDIYRPCDGWTIEATESRSQQNTAVSEIIITRNEQ